MKKRIPEVDKYIADAAPFARPILKKIRSMFHKAHPEITETIKWGFPHFEYKGVIGNMAAFKQHASFGFWKGKLLNDPDGYFADIGDSSMSQRKLTDVSDLPDEKTFMGFVRQAVELNEKNIKVQKPKKKNVEPLDPPEDLIVALKKNKQAKTAFEKFSPSHRREYIEWITEAKQEATRKRRLATALEWMAEGKSRNWKYER